MLVVILFFAIGAMLAACGGGGGDESEGPDRDSADNGDGGPAAAIAITFDLWASTATQAFPIMQARGLVGTWFVDPDQLDGDGVSGDSAALAILRWHGWSIQGYSGANMVNLLAADPAAARARLAAVRRAMAAKGFPITSLAASQRAWSPELRAMAAEQGYQLVRVAKGRGPQAFPFPDPLYIADGGTDSLGASDTVASLDAQLGRLLKNGGAWIVIIHKVGDPSDPAYSIDAATFATFCDHVASAVQAGKLRAITL